MHQRIHSSIEFSVAQRRGRNILAGLIGLGAIIAPAWAAPGLPFTEPFDDTSLREDTGPHATTADWGASAASQLKYHSANPISVGLGASTVPVALPDEATTRIVRLADMDGDGDLDLVVGVAGKSRVHLYDGDTGAFGAANILPGPAANTRGVAVGDVDRDGDIDIVLGNFNVPNRLYLNQGDGISYEMQVISPETRGTDYIVLADFDNDGDLDVATANHNLTNRIYKNTGDPLMPFGPAGIAGTDIGTFVQNAQALAAGDLDNDGDVDIVSLNENQQNRYFLNDGTGNFAIFGQAITTQSFDTQGGALGDLNGDGYLDLVIGNTTPGQVNIIYFNRSLEDPGRIFAGGDDSVAFTTPNNPDYGRAVVLEDVDNDGDLDIFLSTAGTLEVPTEQNYLFLNGGTGAFDAGTAIGSETGIHNSLAVGDVNNDGALDLISGNETRTLDADGNAIAGPAAIQLYLNNGSDIGGPARPQLRSRATSLEVDTEATEIVSVRLNAQPAPLAALNKVEFWLSSNGGQNWVQAAPNGRPVLFPEGKRGADLRWRAVMAAASPGAASVATSGAAAFALDSVAIAMNASGPTRGEIGDQSATQGTPFELDAAFTDDDDPVAHSISGLPLGSGLSIDPLTGLISGTPQPVDTASSPIAITVTATDGALQAQQTFNLTVAGLPGNDPPAFTSTPVVEATQDTAYTYDVTAADADSGDTLTITAVTLPAWLTLTDHGDGTATLAGTPAAADVGDHPVSLQVADQAGATGTQDFTITVDSAGTTPPPANEAPAFTSTAPASATVGTELSYSITTSDPDAGDTRTITGTTVPAWLTLTDNGDGTATLRGTPAAGNVGANPVELTVTDAAGATATQSFTINVAAAVQNPPPNPPTPPPSGGSGGGGGSTAPFELLLLGALVAAGLRRRLLRRGAVE